MEIVVEISGISASGDSVHGTVRGLLIPKYTINNAPNRPAFLYERVLITRIGVEWSGYIRVVYGRTDRWKI